jgi:hypothetical protein
MMFMIACVDTTDVVTGNCAWVAPAGTVTLGGKAAGNGISRDAPKVKPTG